MTIDPVFFRLSLFPDKRITRYLKEKAVNVFRAICVALPFDYKVFNVLD